MVQIGGGCAQEMSKITDYTDALPMAASFCYDVQKAEEHDNKSQFRTTCMHQRGSRMHRVFNPESFQDPFCCGVSSHSVRRAGTTIFPERKCCVTTCSDRQSSLTTSHNRTMTTRSDIGMLVCSYTCYLSQTHRSTGLRLFNGSIDMARFVCSHFG